MVPFSKVQKGVANYLDNEVMAAFKDEGWKRVVVGAGIALTIQRADKFLPVLQQNQFVKTMGLMDEEGNVDVDSLVPVIKEQLKAEPMVVDLSKYGLMNLGKLTFKEGDVDKLADYIKTAK